MKTAGSVAWGHRAEWRKNTVTAGYIQFSMPMLHKRVETVAAYILRHAGRLPSANVVSLDEKKARHR